MDLLSAAEAVPPAHRAVDVPVLVQRTAELLAAGVPLSLLLDLAEEDGPRSRAWYATEPADTSWLVPAPRR